MRRKFGIALFVVGLAATPAVAADLPPPEALPPRAPATYVPMPAPIFTWTGFYIGGNVGWGWTTTTLTDIGPAFPGPGVPPGTQVFPLGTVNTLTQNGFLGGAQLGYNYQFNQFVVGVEGDFDATGIRNSLSAGGLGGATYKDPWTSTFTARVGWAFDHTLIYGKGGGAWMQENYNFFAPDGSAATGTFNRWGWTVGVGIEYAVLNNLTLRAEYDYMNFGTQNQTLTPNALDLVTGNVTGDANSSKLSANVVKVGVNWLFH